MKTGYNFETIILYSKNCETISVVGNNNLPKNLSDLCSAIISLGFDMLKMSGKGEYRYTVITLKETEVLIYLYQDYIIVGFTKEKEGFSLIQHPFQ
ncbi:hypothetical protein [Persephonella sp.]|uniref:hypothetical protein n=1 Tax=Persephonella sp. TaxID=2060922 RepID=UPI0025E1BA74|nr:hypothetical protein [Persephonella sp.]